MTTACSQVYLKNLGAEFAAVMIIKFYQEMGSWQNPVKIAAFQGWISRTSVLNSGNPEHWSQNVFFQPQPNLLIKLGMVNRLPGNDLHLLPSFFKELEKHQQEQLSQSLWDEAHPRPHYSQPRFLSK